MFKQGPSRKLKLARTTIRTLTTELRLARGGDASDLCESDEAGACHTYQCTQHSCYGLCDITPRCVIV
jgi:hypothetical protein